MGEPGLEAEACVTAPVIVAEEVIPVAGTNEQRAEQRVEADRECRPVDEPWVPVDAAGEVDGRKQQASAGERIVPIAVAEAPAARRPVVAGWHPQVIRPAVGVRRGHARPLVEVRGRLRYQLLVLLPVAGPMAVDPAPAVPGLAPVAHHPVPTFGQVAPEAAHP